jgi:hypothetical protein
MLFSFFYRDIECSIHLNIFSATFVKSENITHIISEITRTLVILANHSSRLGLSLPGCDTMVTCRSRSPNVAVTTIILLEYGQGDSHN